MATYTTHTASDQCHRCGGLMVPEELREVNMVGRRCVMCGEHVDSLILEHRRKMQTPEGARDIREKAGKAAFN